MQRISPLPLLVGAVVLAGCIGAGTDELPLAHEGVDAERPLSRGSTEPFDVEYGMADVRVAARGHGNGSLAVGVGTLANSSMVFLTEVHNGSGPLTFQRTICLGPGAYELLVVTEDYEGYADVNVYAKTEEGSCPRLLKPLSERAAEEANTILIVAASITGILGVPLAAYGLRQYVRSSHEAANNVRRLGGELERLDRLAARFRDDPAGGKAAFEEELRRLHALMHEGSIKGETAERLEVAIRLNLRAFAARLDRPDDRNDDHA